MLMPPLLRRPGHPKLAAEHRNVAGCLEPEDFGIGSRLAKVTGCYQHHLRAVLLESKAEFATSRLNHEEEIGSSSGGSQNDGSFRHCLRCSKLAHSNFTSASATTARNRRHVNSVEVLLSGLARPSLRNMHRPQMSAWRLCWALSD